MTKRRLNRRALAAWVEKVGGLARATALIRNALECSQSKAEKLASGRYASLPTAAEQHVLSDLLEESRDSAFPIIRERSKRRETT